MFLDETAATTSMARRYGWAPRGERCRIAVPAGHLKTTTVIAGLRTSGPTAIALLDGPVTGERFRACVSDTLVPTLQRGDTVVLDNLGAHKVVGVREAIEAAGARVLYLPPYSRAGVAPVAHHPLGRARQVVEQRDGMRQFMSPLRSHDEGDSPPEPIGDHARLGAIASTSPSTGSG